MFRFVPAAGAIMGALLFSSVPLQQAVAVEQDASGTIEEIIVTTRRREESVQDVPISVTVLASSKLSG